MTAFLIRRIGQAAAVVVGVMMLTFVLIHLEPGSAANRWREKRCVLNYSSWVCGAARCVAERPRNE